MSNKSRISLWIGIVLITSTGLIHVLDAPDSFSEAAYKGWLFYLNGAGALIAAYGIYRKHNWGWKLGFLISAGSFLAYVSSRTLGLPQIPAEPDAWLEPMGVASLITEGLFMMVFVCSGCICCKGNQVIPKGG